MKWIPSLRKMNGKVEFHFETAALFCREGVYTVQLDDLEWKFVRTNESGMSLFSSRGVPVRRRDLGMEDVFALVRYCSCPSNTSAESLHMDVSDVVLLIIQSFFRISLCFNHLFENQLVEDRQKSEHREDSGTVRKYKNWSVRDYHWIRREWI